MYILRHFRWLIFFFQFCIDFIGKYSHFAFLREIRNDQNESFWGDLYPKHTYCQAARQFYKINAIQKDGKRNAQIHARVCVRFFCLLLLLLFPRLLISKWMYVFESACQPCIILFRDVFTIYMNVLHTHSMDTLYTQRLLCDCVELDKCGSAW